MKIIFSALLIAMTLAGCGSDNNDKSPLQDPTEGLGEICGRSMTNIVNGSDLEPQDADSKKSVLIYIQKVKSHTTCTGALIGRRMILTAAHCLKDIPPQTVKVLFLKSDSCNPQKPQYQKINVEKIIIHDQYNKNGNYNNDLALMKLERAAPGDFPTASLYDGESPLSADDLLMVGYGDSTESSDEENQLRKTKKSFSRDVVLENKEIVFDQSNATGGACHGDSGGPVYGVVGGQYKIVGIISRARGPKETACHQSSLASFMPFYREWIEKNSQFD
jgi:secreted trypsin-like serine protease